MAIFQERIKVKSNNKERIAACDFLKVDHTFQIYRTNNKQFIRAFSVLLLSFDHAGVWNAKNHKRSKKHI